MFYSQSFGGNRKAYKVKFKQWVMISVFPAHAGINRAGWQIQRQGRSVPRTCGDKPITHITDSL